MSTRFALALSLSIFFARTTAAAQVASSEGLACTLTREGAVSCNGIASVGAKRPSLSLTHYIIEPGAELRWPDGLGCDGLLLGVSLGELVNEGLPNGVFHLTPDSVFLLPKEQTYVLRNKSSQNVEVRLAEVRR